GSDVTAIDRAGNPTDDPAATVAYLVNDPTAKYIRAGIGTVPNVGRNTLPLRPTNNFDAGVMKRVSITERVKLQLQGQFSNLFNHPQYTGGYINHVDAANPALVSITTGVGVRNMLTPGNSLFNRPDLTFLGNARQITVVAKLTF
ncbi:MAG: carboxypeptidase regulatory-like domain-containing protein, partial [Acidobacteriota bacterium]